MAQRKIGFPEYRYTCNGCREDIVSYKPCSKLSVNIWHGHCFDAFRAQQSRERNARNAKQAEQRTAEAEASSWAMQAAHKAQLANVAKAERRWPYK